MSGEAMDIDMQTHSGHGEVDDDGREKRTGNKLVTFISFSDVE